MAGPVVVTYDPEWPRLFEAERARLEAVLARWLEHGIHHIGSTAVPGLAAKPLIDMIAGVRDLEEARASFEPLHVSRLPLQAASPGGAPLLESGIRHPPDRPGSDIWRERFAFRDALRANDELAAQYAEWKLAHAGPAPGGTPYTAGKRPFVARVLTQAGLELKEDRERLTDEALAARARAATARAPS